MDENVDRNVETHNVDLEKIASRRQAFKDGFAAVKETFENDRLGQFGLAILGIYIVMGIIGPIIAPYDPFEIQRGSSGSVLRLAEPSLNHPFGTTQMGRDVFSQTIISARVSLIVGSIAAFISVFIGTNIALWSAYIGGTLDAIAMRLADIAYSLPLLPFIIVLVGIFGASLWTVIFAITIIMWRSTARVVRSMVLSHKERAYVESAEAIGASKYRIMYLHILPNALPIVFLYVALSVGWSVVTEASVAFLGYSDPHLISRGRMIYEAYNTGAIRYAYWWVLPAGLSLILFVSSVFYIGRSLEELTNPELRYQE